MLTGQVGLITDKRHWMGRAILRITGWRYHHTVIAVSESHCVSAEPGGVRRRPITDYPGIIWSQYAMTDKQAHMVAGIAEYAVGCRYDYLACAAHAIAAVTHTDTPAWLQRWLADRAPTTCSALAKTAIDAARLRTPHGPLPTPNDWEFYFRARGWI